MAPVRRIVIDTDPGVDDILALLLALAATPAEVEVVLISIVFGNIDVQNCLRNAVSMFHIIERELEWRRNRGQSEGFDSLKAFKPIIAVGAERPLEDQLLTADYFHGMDGLGEIHTTASTTVALKLPHPPRLQVNYSQHPHLTPDDTWKTLFQALPRGVEDVPAATPQNTASPASPFTASRLVAHKEILRVLRENEPDTITIVAIGPLTNLAMAAAEDPETFLRVKEVVVMGGTIDVKGNVTPVAEFNCYADAVASARVFALTSIDPSSMLPSLTKASLRPYPQSLSRPLKLTLFPLDTTSAHELLGPDFEAKVKPLIEQGSPLAEWVAVFVRRTFQKLASLSIEGGDLGLSLHDPLCIWYILTPNSPAWLLTPSSPEDIRVEYAGKWTRGMCVVDRRLRRKATNGEVIVGDVGEWLNPRKGNRVRRMVGSPGKDAFAHYLLERIFGSF